MSSKRILKTAELIVSLSETGVMSGRIPHIVELKRPAMFITGPEGTSMRAHGLETPPLKDKPTAALSWAQLAQEACL